MNPRLQQKSIPLPLPLARCNKELKKDTYVCCPVTEPTAAGLERKISTKYRPGRPHYIPDTVHTICSAISDRLLCDRKLNRCHGGAHI